jgi:hypothetical protein
MEYNVLSLLAHIKANLVKYRISKPAKQDILPSLLCKKMEFASKPWARMLLFRQKNNFIFTRIVWI